jgi:hypothetical protein
VAADVGRLPDAILNIEPHLLEQWQAKPRAAHIALTICAYEKYRFFDSRAARQLAARDRLDIKLGNGAVVLELYHRKLTACSEHDPGKFNVGGRGLFDELHTQFFSGQCGNFFRQCTDVLTAGLNQVIILYRFGSPGSRVLDQQPDIDVNSRTTQRRVCSCSKSTAENPFRHLRLPWEKSSR